MGWSGWVYESNKWDNWMGGARLIETYRTNICIGLFKLNGRSKTCDCSWRERFAIPHTDTCTYIIATTHTGQHTEEETWRKHYSRPRAGGAGYYANVMVVYYPTAHAFTGANPISWANCVVCWCFVLISDVLDWCGVPWRADRHTITTHGVPWRADRHTITTHGEPSISTGSIQDITLPHLEMP